MFGVTINNLWLNSYLSFVKWVADKSIKWGKVIKK